MRRKLKVRRKGYRRGAYTRKGGVRVKESKVSGSSFSIRDRGKPGRTPKSQRFFHPKRHTGWRADMPAERRRSLVKSAHGGNLLSSARSMQALANVQRRINPSVSAKAKSDADYFFRLNRQRGGTHGRHRRRR
jgi:hypothetical protein